MASKGAHFQGWITVMYFQGWINVTSYPHRVHYRHNPEQRAPSQASENLKDSQDTMFKPFFQGFVDVPSLV
eukprot:15361195-Ditylum_brightwellii.AAC.1